MVHGLAVAAAAGYEPAGDHRALRHGIHLAVRRLERREHQQSPLQVGGISNSGSRNVDARPGLRERRQGSRNHHRGRVLYPDGGSRHRDTHTFQQVRQALRREDGLLTVTGPG